MFKQFLRINTMHPNPDLKSCVDWLSQIAKDLKLTMQVVEFVKGKPVVVVSRIGTDPSLPSIGLNCHMDVVPVVVERWSKLPKGETPFSAWEDTDGKIYARGTQDMKCVGAQYLCALQRLSTTPLRRTVHTIWVPDEEIGGEDGMKKFVHSAEFKALNLGCVMDEGLSHEGNVFVVYTGERTSMWARFEAVGPVGHGAKLIPNTAIERLTVAIDKLATRRRANVQKLETNPKLKIGDVTTVNITVLNGGTSNDGGKTFAPNVIPSDAFIIADIRASLQDFQEVVAELKSIASEQNLKLSFEDNFQEEVGPSPYSDRRSPFLQSIQNVLSSHQGTPEVELQIFPAATDSRYVRRVGVPAFGFSPMRNTPSLLHDHNEYLERSVYLDGVDVMTKLVRELAQMPAIPKGHM